MTINERLYTAGLLHRFDDAVRQGNVASIIELLTQVEIAPTDAAKTAATIMAHPTRYGRLNSN